MADFTRDGNNRSPNPDAAARPQNRNARGRDPRDPRFKSGSGMPKPLADLDFIQNSGFLPPDSGAAADWFDPWAAELATGSGLAQHPVAPESRTPRNVGASNQQREHWQPGGDLDSLVQQVRAEVLRSEPATGLTNAHTESRARAQRVNKRLKARYNVAQKQPANPPHSAPVALAEAEQILHELQNQPRDFPASGRAFFPRHTRVWARMARPVGYLLLAATSMALAGLAMYAMLRYLIE